jgi:hypothetical protein
MGGYPRFQALILATGALFDAALSKAAQEELEVLEREIGVRRLTAYAFPGPRHGLQQAYLLRAGQLAWLTRGRYLRHERNYLSLQIDDVLLPNDGWDAASHSIDMDPKAMIRMTPDDAARGARWVALAQPAPRSCLQRRNGGETALDVPAVARARAQTTGGGIRSGWTLVAPGETVLDQAVPRGSATS